MWTRNLHDNLRIWFEDCAVRNHDYSVCIYMPSDGAAPSWYSVGHYQNDVNWFFTKCISYNKEGRSHLGDRTCSLWIHIYDRPYFKIAAYSVSKVLKWSCQFCFPFGFHIKAIYPLSDNEKSFSFLIYLRNLTCYKVKIRLA